MPRRHPQLRTERLRLFLPGAADAAAMLDYYSRNRDHLEPWEPSRSPEFYSEIFWERQLVACREEFREERGARFALALREQPERIIGVANLSNLVRGAFQAAHLGYSLDAGLQGHGLVTEALEEVVRYAFEDLALHRVMANYQPHNERSAKVLKRLGFQKEGYAHGYLFINGEWRDHVLTARVAPGA